MIRIKIDIDFLPLNKQRELRQIVEYVSSSEDISVHMIILFGSHARDSWVYDVYQDESGTTYSYKSDYDLLFIMKDEKTAKNSSFMKSIKRRIKENCNIETRTSFIFHGIAYFNGELRERNYFFIDIYEEGVLLYDSRKYALISPPEVLPKNTRLMKARRYYSKWLNSADGFLMGYDYYYKNKNYNLAVFHLHQTCEHLYMGTLLVHTDYKPKSHDLLDLDQRVREVNGGFEGAFPCRTKEEEELFKKLSNSYIDSRYEKDYVISIEELDYMVERVKVLQKLAEDLCRDFIIKFAEEISDISEELMEKIKNTHASNPGFYENRETAEFIEQKRVKAIENRKEVEVTEKVTKDVTDKLTEEFAEEAEVIERKAKLEIARKMLAKGMDVETVSEMTGLGVEEVEGLKD